MLLCYQRPFHYAAGDSDEEISSFGAPPPPLVGTDASRVTSGLGSSVTRGSGSTLGSEAGAHLSSLDLAAALQASNIAGVLPTLQAQQRAAAMGEDGLSSGSEPHYLHHERRGLWGQAAYNIGYSYFGGLAVGGFVGFANGLRRSPNNSPRVLLNSVLNGCGKSGAKAGNAAGVLAMVYTGEQPQRHRLRLGSRRGVYLPLFCGTAALAPTLIPGPPVSSLPPDCAVLERQAEDLEVDKLPGLVNRLIGYDVMGSR